jgi:hypothetical protein
MSLLALTFAALLAAQTPPSPNSELEKLKAELEKQRSHNQDLQRQLDSANTMLNKLEQTKAYDLLRAETEKLQADLAAKAAAATGLPRLAAPPPVAPAPPVYYQFAMPESKITAVANEIDLVVVSIGSDDGVVEGQIYSITRGGESVGSLKIDRVDRKWAAGRVTRKKSEPRVGDAVGPEKVGSKTLQYVAPAARVLSSADELKIIRKELDDVRLEVRKLSDRIVPAWQGQGVSVEEVPEELRAHLSILRGLLVRRVREGSPAEKAGLKANDVVPDLLEAQLVQAIESGMPIHVIRQGQRVRLPGATGK